MDNAIDGDFLNNATEDRLKEWIPSSGHRLNILLKWNNL